MKLILKMNLDSREWLEIPSSRSLDSRYINGSKSNLYDSKLYYQSDGFERDYYTHVVRFERFGWSFFTPIPKKENPRISFLFWDNEKIDISHLPKYRSMSPHMNDEKLTILNSYLRDRKIETIIK